MRKANPMVEMRVLASICNTNYPDRKFKYFGAVNEEHFGTQGTREIFTRIRTIVEGGGQIPTLPTLAEDLRLSSDARVMLSTTGAQKFASEPDYAAGVRILTAYYKNRRLLHLHQILTETLRNDNAPQDFSAVEKIMEETMFHLRADVNEEHILDGSANSEEMLKLARNALTYAEVGRRFKTGWGRFDELIGGLEPGNVMLLTANSGGGKSIAAMSLLANMYREFSQTVTYISLEMDEREMMERLVANATMTDISLIRQGKLSPVEREAIFQKYKTEFHEASHGRYSFYAPKGDYTIEQLFSQIQGKPTDVIILDYLGLVKPGGYGKNTSEEYQLRQMTRLAKRYAEKMKCAVVLLAQLNDEGQIMYSKGIGHHVHYWLKWMCKDEDFERGYAIVEMGKSRNSRKEDLYMTTEFKYMRMDNITEPAGAAEARAASASATPQAKPGADRKHAAPQAPRAPKTDLGNYGSM